MNELLLHLCSQDLTVAFLSTKSKTIQPKSSNDSCCCVCCVGISSDFRQGICVGCWRLRCAEQRAHRWYVQQCARVALSAERRFRRNAERGPASGPSAFDHHANSGRSSDGQDCKVAPIAVCRITGRQLLSERRELARRPTISTHIRTNVRASESRRVAVVRHSWQSWYATLYCIVIFVEVFWKIKTCRRQIMKATLRRRFCTVCVLTDGYFRANGTRDDSDSDSDNRRRRRRVIIRQRNNSYRCRWFSSTARCFTRNIWTRRFCSFRER